MIGIIPTRVGTSPVNFCCWKLEKDHPHACGDKFQDALFSNNVEGSSPRVWGQVCKKLNITVENRIIPTRVGTSYCPNLTKILCRDHPHACGDKSILYVIRLVSLGSSPRVWGQDAEARIHRCRGRIIPTRVGTRYLIFYHAFTLWDHPHACGDKVIQCLKK